ncbi:MAG TPA: DUF5723 family protein [Draconibacterium sp.]|nr:DUF5723 family protein [Draconibacterium sp.]
MNKKHLESYRFYIVFLFLSLLITGKSFAQITGSLFMLPNNFYAQMYNPAYMRTDEAIEISIAGLGGFSFMNQGSFKISDLIATPSGSPVIDPVNFYENINTNNFIRQDLAVPMVFFSVPLKNGRFSFYYKENVGSLLKFKKSVIEFLVNGNLEPGYQNFNTDAMKVLTAGYREFAFGYAKKKNKKLDIGMHAKLLFGAALLNADDWNFGIETASDGGVIHFISGGKGHLMLPVSIRLRADSTIFSIEGEKVLSKYIKSYNNPGFAIDLGATYQLDKKSKISVSIRDLGLILYNDKSLTLRGTGNYNYIGFDLVHAVRWPEEPGYTNPSVLIDVVKDSIRNIWHPKAVEKSFAFGLGPKTVLHYQRDFSDLLSLGVTNQTTFQKNNFRNALSLTAMQSWLNLSVFENVNLYGINSVSVGGGIQYEGNFAQVFLATDNLFAFYHPANNKTFSITAGVCILLNHQKEIDPDKITKKGIKKRKGKISPDLPYYKHLRSLKN